MNLQMGPVFTGPIYIFAIIFPSFKIAFRLLIPLARSVHRIPTPLV